MPSLFTEAQILAQTSFEIPFPANYWTQGQNTLSDYPPFRDIESRTTWGHASSVTRARSGAASWRIELRYDDPEAQWGNRRAEQSITLNGTQQWYRWSTYQPSSTWQPDTKEEIFPAQWHDKDASGGNFSTSPPLAFEVKNGRHRAMIRYATADYRIAANRKIVNPNGLDMGPVLYDQWVDWVVQYIPKYDGTGRVKIWKNGTVVVDYSGPCHYNGSTIPYLKMGIYKWLWTGAVTTPTVRIGYIDMFALGGATSTYEMMSLTGPVPTINLAPTITMPTNQSLAAGTLTTSATADDADADGTVVSRLWAQVNGPNTPTLTGTTTKTLGISGLASGAYTFSYKVTDDKGLTATKTMQINVDAVNVAPTANAGANIVRPPLSTTATLSATGSTDPDGTIVSYSWVKISGAGGTITNPTSATTGLTGLTPGTNYVYQVTVTDDDGAIGRATVSVSIQPQALPPVITPSQPVVVTRSTTNTTGVSVSAASQTSTIASYAWTQTEGPNTAVITNGTTSNPTVSSLIIGLYTFRVVVTDAQGLTATATVTVRVNKPPTVDLDANTAYSFIKGVVNVPIVSVGADLDGSIVSGVWQLKKGTGTFADSTSANTVFTAAGPGEYILTRVVTDNDGEEGSEDYSFTIQSGYLKVTIGTRRVLPPH